MTAAHESTITTTRVGVWARCTCGWEETIRVDIGSPSKAGAAAFAAHLSTALAERTEE